MDEAGTWHGGRPQPRRLCVRWGLAPLPQKGAEPPPQFLAHFYCGQTAKCIKMPFSMDVGLSPGDFVLDGEPVIPKFSAHVYCGQTAGWIKMSLGMEVGLGLRDIVFDVEAATPRRKGHTHSHPIFGPCLLWPRSPISSTAELLLEYALT